MAEELLHLNAHETIRIVHETADELEVEATWDPESSPPPPHLHPAQDEEFEVRSGELTAVVDGVERTLRPGDTFGIPRGTTHKMWNAGGETAIAAWRTRPAGRSAEWSRAVDRLGISRVVSWPGGYTMSADVCEPDAAGLVARPR
jgi:quercetin dioxygenase-like cupin family protein